MDTCIKCVGSVPWAVLSSSAGRFPCLACTLPPLILLTISWLVMHEVAHVTALCQAGYNQLRQLWPVFCLLSVRDTKMLVRAFISCCLDCCNSLLYHIGDWLLCRVQSVQNAAVHLVISTQTIAAATALASNSSVSRFEHHEAHSVTSWTINHVPFGRLSDVGRHTLQSGSNNIWKLVVPQRHNKFGDRIFLAAGPRL